MPLLDGLRQTLMRAALLQDGDRLLVAVSGGPDSLSLLHAFLFLREEFNLTLLQAAHFNHNLRGEESARDAEFVREFCREHAVPCHLGGADVAAEAVQKRISTQEAARYARYAFLEMTAQQIGANKIATAHTQDDQAETILLNILRGTGTEGLRGIPRARGIYIRPLLDCSHFEVEAYCVLHGLTPRRDSSNLEAAHYTRNRIRLELLPQLARDYNPAIKNALLRLSQIAMYDADYLAQQAAAALAEATLSQTRSKLVLDNHKLRLLHPALLRHVLRAAFAEHRGTRMGLTHDHIEALCAALCKSEMSPFGLTTPVPHCFVRITSRRLTLTLPLK